MTNETPHDTGYKLLFSHPEMVRDLLIGYMPGEWLKEADCTSLSRVNGSVPDRAQECLSNASAEQLTQWAGVILTDKSIDELFGTEGPVH